MQKNTQELIDSELLDTLKKNYYFELEENLGYTKEQVFYLFCWYLCLQF